MFLDNWISRAVTLQKTVFSFVLCYYKSYTFFKISLPKLHNHLIWSSTLSVLLGSLNFSYVTLHSNDFTVGFFFTNNFIYNYIQTEKNSPTKTPNIHNTKIPKSAFFLKSLPPQTDKNRTPKNLLSTHFSETSSHL